MGSTPISTAFLLKSLAAVMLLEGIFGFAEGSIQYPYLLLLIKRASQSVVLVVLSTLQTGGLAAIGFDSQHLRQGIKTGLLWSAGFAVFAGVLLGGLLLVGQDPIKIIHTPLPKSVAHTALFFFVGGMIGPVFEEIAFRGIIFGYLRRWGVSAAVLLSTALFAAVHLPTIPITQVVGGMVFALAYHASKSLVAPIVIHMLGNLAIFAISLFAT